MWSGNFVAYRRLVVCLVIDTITCLFGEICYTCITGGKKNGYLSPMGIYSLVCLACSGKNAIAHPSLCPRNLFGTNSCSRTLLQSLLLLLLLLLLLCCSECSVILCGNISPTHQSNMSIRISKSCGCNLDSAAHRRAGGVL